MTVVESENIIFSVTNLQIFYIYHHAQTPEYALGLLTKLSTCLFQDWFSSFIPSLQIHNVQ